MSVYTCPTLSVNAGKCERVYVVYCADANEFYVWQMNRYESNNVFHENLQQSYSELRSVTKLQRDDLLMNMAVVVEVENNHFYRATILALKVNCLLVKLVDMGEKVDIKYEQVYRCTREFLHQPTQAIACCLSGFEYFERFTSDSALMKQLIRWCEGKVLLGEIQGACINDKLIHIRLLGVPNTFVLPETSHQYENFDFVLDLNHVLLQYVSTQSLSTKLTNVNVVRPPRPKSDIFEHRASRYTDSNKYGCSEERSSRGRSVEHPTDADLYDEMDRRNYVPHSRNRGKYYRRSITDRRDTGKFTPKKRE